MSNYQEKPLQPEIQTDIEEWIVYGRSTLGLSDHSSPYETLKAVGDFISSWQEERRNTKVVDDPETVTETVLSLATLWGDAFCREFGWQWACVEYKEQGQDLYAVQIRLDFPDSLTQTYTFNEAEWMREIAIALFQNAHITLDQGVQLAGIPQPEFQQLLISRDITILGRL